MGVKLCTSGRMVQGGLGPRGLILPVRGSQVLGSFYFNKPRDAVFTGSELKCPETKDKRQELWSRIMVATSQCLVK